MKQRFFFFTPLFSIGMPVIVICLLFALHFAQATVKGPTGKQNCFNSRGEPAIAACRELLKADDDNLKVMKRLSDMLTELERFDESLDILDRARQLYPSNKRIAHKIKVTKSMEAEKILFAEEEESAAKNARQKISKTNAKVSRLLCLRLKGNKGLDACQKALKNDPEDSALHQAYADLLAAAGRKSEADKAYKIAQKLHSAGSAPAKTIPKYQKKSVNLAKNGKSPTTGSGSNTPAKSVPKHLENSVTLAKNSERPITAGPSSSTPIKSVPKPQKKPVKPGKSGESHSIAAAGSGSIADKLRELKTLYDQKLIDENDYTHRKNALMDQTFGKVRTKSSKQKAKTADTQPRIKYGEYHALVIGIQNYKHLTKLEMAQNDVAEVSKLLEIEYGFRVVLLKDPTRRQILMALGKMRRTLKENDNLLIYYAGHGWLDRDADTGYWMPVDAASDNDIDWLSLNSVTSAARAIPAKHLMIVADSCFSGKLTRGLHIEMKQRDHLSKMASRRTRVVLTSGGLEPVLDAGGGKHSVFAAAFLEILRENKKVIDGTTLFSRLRRTVMLKASQTPEYSDIRRAGHEGGDFLFVHKSYMES